MDEQLVSIELDIDENIDNLLVALKTEVADYRKNELDLNSEFDTIKVCTQNELNTDSEILRLFN